MNVSKYDTALPMFKAHFSIFRSLFAVRSFLRLGRKKTKEANMKVMVAILLVLNIPVAFTSKY